MDISKLYFIPVDTEITVKDFPLPQKKINWHWWTYEQLLDKSSGIFDNSPWRQDLDTSLSSLKNIVEQLPLTGFSNVRLTIQNQPVDTHLDIYEKHGLDKELYEHFVSNEPCGYRFLLSGSTDALEVFDGRKWRTARLPASPGCYLINTTRALHRVKEDKDRLTLYVRGTVDVDRHKALIEKNLEKYSDYAIFEA